MGETGFVLDSIEAESSRSKRQPNWVVLAAAAGFSSAVFALLVPFVMPGFRRLCLPYIPSSEIQLAAVGEAIRELPIPLSSVRVVDLGSGDGRVVRYCEQLGVKSAHGCELNRWLVYYSRWVSWRSRIGHRTRFFRTDMFKMDLSNYDAVIVFGVPALMPPLRDKLSSELGDKGRLIAARFPVEGVRPLRQINTGFDSVWVYDVTVLRDSPSV